MENKKTEVDIILPNYNSSEFIEKTIDSVIGQTHKNWNLIIVDDCSDEKTKKILNKYSQNKNIQIVFLDKNKGAAFCRNHALELSKSEYVAFLDSDDVWFPDKLIKQINFMKKNNYNFTYTNYTLNREDRYGLYKYQRGTGYDMSNQNSIRPREKYNFDSFIKDTSIATSTMMIKGELARKYKFTDTKICEDYFYKCSILKEIGYAYCLNESDTLYRIRKDSLQSKKLRNLYWIWKINSKFNKLNFFNNLNSVISISLKSLKKYGFK
tara:strand:+ start:363 stop:1163 length:801 start_codon:yes stop_codon:yes gene_type:complete